jgi:hypothetical protein
VRSEQLQVGVEDAAGVGDQGAGLEDAGAVEDLDGGRAVLALGRRGLVEGFGGVEVDAETLGLGDLGGTAEVFVGDGVRGVRTETGGDPGWAAVGLLVA